MFEEYDVVILRRKKLDIPVPVGSRGTIVHVLDAGSGEFLVEFPGNIGCQVRGWESGPRWLAPGPGFDGNHKVR